MPRHLPLHPVHQALGAVFQTAGDWELPARYAGPLREYEAARGACALADVSHWGKLLFSGADRAEFLNGLLTNDVQNLPPGKGFPACLLTPHGKLTGDFWLYNRGEDLLSLHPSPAAPAVSRSLSKYLPLSETVLEDLTASHALFSLSGPRASDVLQKTLGVAVPGPLGCADLLWNEAPATLFSWPAYQPDGFLILGPAPAARSLWSALLETGRPAGLQPLGFEALEILRVESGRPAFGVDMNEDNYPLEAGLEEAVSFTKGCYLGQETTARTKHHARLPRRLAGLRLSARARPGASLLREGRPAATITSVVESPALGGTLALALVPADRSEPGARFEIGDEKGGAAAEVVPFPCRQGG